MLSTVATAREPLPCPSCLGNGYFGEYRKSSSQDCRDCRGTGHQRCTECKQHPSDAPAVAVVNGMFLCEQCAEQDARDAAEYEAGLAVAL
jgi:hypothetical protein